jgi:hypothetical protein
MLLVGVDVHVKGRGGIQGSILFYAVCTRKPSRHLSAEIGGKGQKGPAIEENSSSKMKILNGGAAIVPLQVWTVSYLHKNLTKQTKESVVSTKSCQY